MFSPDMLEASLGSHEVVLRPGEGLLLYTGGLVEAMDGTGRQLGDEVVLDHLTRGPGRSAGERVRSLVARVDVHRGERPATDDFTLPILQRGVVPSLQPEVVHA